MGWNSRVKFANHVRSEKGNVCGMIKDDRIYQVPSVTGEKRIPILHLIRFLQFVMHLTLRHMNFCQM